MFYGEPTVALFRYVEARRGATVRFSCSGCGSGHDIDAVHLIWLLKALNLGDERTSVADCARLAQLGCVRCGGTRWEAWPSPATERR